jgi:hypothetical protein
MRLSPPKQITFYISVVLAALGVLGELVTISFLSDYSIWFVVVGYVVLALGNLLSGF